MQTGRPAWWNDAVAALSNDELIGEIVKKYPDGCLEGKGDLFQTTIRSIVGQQISVIASDAIWGRLVKMLGSATPENVMKFTQEEIAACGLTRPKSSYVHGLAANSELLLNQDWENMTDKEIKQHLIQFKGIGPWTAEMMLMFSFMRPDVFSVGDIGLVKAVKILAPQAESKDDVEEIDELFYDAKASAKILQEQ